MQERVQRRDAAIRRQSILAAAELAFAEKGLDVPLEEICVAAGVGRATLYRNFENRIALVHAIMRNNLDKLDTLVDDVGGDPHGLEAYLAEILDQLVKTGALVFLIRRDPDLDRNLSSRYLAHLEQLTTTARSAGVIRSDATVEMVEIVVRMMSGALNGLAFAERRAAAATVFDLCLAALDLRTRDSR